MRKDRSDQTPQTPLDALWRAPVIVSTLLAGESVAAILALAPGVPGSRWAYFGLASLMIQWVALTTLGSLYLCRRPLSRMQPHYIAYFALLLLLLSTWLVGGTGWLLLYEAWGMDRDNWHGMFLRITGIALTVGLLGLVSFQNHWRTQQLAVRAKQSELEALQARIRPHFLFNTLNTGAALVHLRPADAEQLLLDLADLFRAALAGPREIALIDELSLTRRYLEIESLRFGDRLRVNWNLPDPLPAAFIPTLSIQPLVENAIRHGVEPSASGGVIEISVSTSPSMADITIRNSLPPAGTIDRVGHRVGLDSVRARVHALTQGYGRLETSSDREYYTATIFLPTEKTRPAS